MMIRSVGTFDRAYHFHKNKCPYRTQRKLYYFFSTDEIFRRNMIKHKKKPEFKNSGFPYLVQTALVERNISFVLIMLQH
ncbi:hypothetical protein C4F50_20890 [Flavobacterium sp. KB82]|uniref:Uncharacterized protein n=1 Tax=Flavobacterium hungaricum TaxID=2082725 RepID=A0ABR9TPU4_9FLAO|nr:hypothetical protein [Flavobacterium hungaricum]